MSRVAEIKYTPVFQRNWEAEELWVINRGGTRSSKSYSICQQLFVWLLTGQITQNKYILKGVASVVRKFGATLERTILRDFKEVIENFGYSDLIEYNITKREFSFKDHNGTRIVEFFGADDQQKVRGARRDILYCNEANELNWETEFFQLRIRTREKIIIDFNPDSEYVWIKTELEDKRNLVTPDGEPVIPGGCSVIVSTFRDNPFLEPFIVKQIEAMKYEDPIKWRVYGEGEYGIAEGMVFSNYEVVSKIPDGAKFLGYGLDFGYSQDPTVLSAAWIANNELYVKEVFRRHGMTNTDIALEMALHNIDKRDEICADSAEPKSIEELSRMGWQIHGTTKGRDSIRVGIDIMRRYKINIHFESEELIKEMRGYKWETDKNGQTIKPERPKGGQDHCFAGDTMVICSGGIPKKIKNVQKGEYVLTSDGYKEVIKRWDNGKKQVFKYLMLFGTEFVEIEATEDHLIKTNEGWKKISELSQNQTVFLCKDSMGRIIGSTQTSVISKAIGGICTMMFGSTITERFQRVIIYIILTKTHITTSLKTSNVLKPINILLSMVKRGLGKTLNGLKSFMQKALKRLRIGTKAKRVSSGIEKMLKNVILGIKHTAKEIAWFVKKSLKPKNMMQSFVTPTASPNTEGFMSKKMRKDNAQYAKINSLQTNIQERKLVGIWSAKMNQCYVHDLMVEGQHEYFANGVLVHNCIDSIRYICLKKLAKPQFGKYKIY